MKEITFGLGLILYRKGAVTLALTLTPPHGVRRIRLSNHPSCPRCCGWLTYWTGCTKTSAGGANYLSFCRLLSIWFKFVAFCSLRGPEDVWDFLWEGKEKRGMKNSHSPLAFLLLRFGTSDFDYLSYKHSFIIRSMTIISTISICFEFAQEGLDIFLGSTQSFHA